MPSAFCHQMHKRVHALPLQFSPFALCPVRLALPLALGKGGDYQDLLAPPEPLTLQAGHFTAQLCMDSMPPVWSQPPGRGHKPITTVSSANPLYFLLYVPVLLKGIDENNLLTDKVKIK